MDVYEMQKVRQGGRAARRFMGLCWILFAVCVLCAYMLKQYPDAPGPNLVWLLFAFVVAVAGIGVAVVKWLFTGRL